MCLKGLELLPPKWWCMKDPMLMFSRRFMSCISVRSCALSNIREFFAFFFTEKTTRFLLRATKNKSKINIHSNRNHKCSSWHKDNKINQEKSNTQNQVRRVTITHRSVIAVRRDRRELNQSVNARLTVIKKRKKEKTREFSTRAQDRTETAGHEASWQTWAWGSFMHHHFGGRSSSPLRHIQMQYVIEYINTNNQYHP